MSDPDLIGTLVADRFSIQKRIGAGSFGVIYLAVDIVTNIEVAVKLEKKDNIFARLRLRHESKICHGLRGNEGFCQAFYFGDHLGIYNVLVMELMGPSLNDLFDAHPQNFSLKTVLQIADQVLVRLNTLHEIGIVHRDIKPGNFVMGLGEKSGVVHSVDFGLSKLYRCKRTLEHYHVAEDLMAGTARFSSITTHQGVFQTRRDDMEALAYMLIYFLKGELPWQGIQEKNCKIKNNLTLQKKERTTIESLCEGLPKEFAEFLRYARSLKYNQKPDLDYTRKLFHDLYVARGYDTVQGTMWDWDSLDVAESGSEYEYESELEPESEPVSVPAPAAEVMPVRDSPQSTAHSSRSANHH